MSSVVKDLFRGLEEILKVDSISSIKSALSPLGLMIVALLIIISSLFTASLLSLSVLGALTLLLATFLRIPLRRYLIRSAIFALFVFSISIPVAFLAEGMTLFTINIGPLTLSPSFEGTYRVAQFVLRAWVCIASLTMLTSTLGIDGIINILSKTKIPRIILQTISLTYRYIFLSIHEAQSMLLAREARRFRRKKFMNIQDLQDLGKIMAALFMRTFDRSERVYLAMKARGFSFEGRRYPKIQSLNMYDLSLILIVVALIFLSLTSIF